MSKKVEPKIAVKNKQLLQQILRTTTEIKSVSFIIYILVIDGYTLSILIVNRGTAMIVLCIRIVNSIIIDNCIEVCDPQSGIPIKFIYSMRATSNILDDGVAVDTVIITPIEIKFFLCILVAHWIGGTMDKIPVILHLINAVFVGIPLLVVIFESMPSENVQNKIKKTKLRQNSHEYNKQKM